MNGLYIAVHWLMKFRGNQSIRRGRLDMGVMKLELRVESRIAPG